MRLTIEIDQRAEELPLIKLAYSKDLAIDITPIQSKVTNNHPSGYVIDNMRIADVNESTPISDTNSLLHVEIQSLKDQITKLKFEKSILVKWVEYLF